MKFVSLIFLVFASTTSWAGETSSDLPRSLNLESNDPFNTNCLYSVYMKSTGVSSLVRHVHKSQLTLYTFMNEKDATSKFPMENRLAIQSDKKGEGEGDEPMHQLLEDGSMSDTDKFFFQTGDYEIIEHTCRID